MGLAIIVYIEIYSNTHGRLFTYPQQEIGAGLSAGLLLIGLVIASPATHRSTASSASSPSCGSALSPMGFISISSQYSCC